MNQETFIVNGREFTCHRANTFAANTLLIRLQKIIVPVLGALFGEDTKASGSVSLGDMDVKEMAELFSSYIDESIMTTIVLPLFAESKLYSVEDKKFIKDEMGINACFTSENLFDLYELIFLVGRFQFEPFLTKMVNRFGGLTDGKKTAEDSPASWKPS